MTAGVFSRFHNDPSPVLKTGEDVRASIEREYFSKDEVRIDFNFRYLSPRFSKAIADSWKNRLPQEKEVLEQLQRGSDKEEFTVTLNPFFTAYYLKNSPLEVTNTQDSTCTYAPEGHPCIVAYPYSPDMPKDKQDAIQELLIKACSTLNAECVWLNSHPKTIRRKNSVEDLEITLSAL